MSPLQQPDPPNKPNLRIQHSGSDHSCHCGLSDMVIIISTKSFPLKLPPWKLIYSIPEMSWNHERWTTNLNGDNKSWYKLPPWKLTCSIPWKLVAGRWNFLFRWSLFKEHDTFWGEQRVNAWKPLGLVGSNQKIIFGCAHTCAMLVLGSVLVALRRQKRDRVGSSRKERIQKIVPKNPQA